MVRFLAEPGFGFGSLLLGFGSCPSLRLTEIVLETGRENERRCQVIRYQCWRAL